MLRDGSSRSPVQLVHKGVKSTHQSISSPKLLSIYLSGLLACLPVCELLSTAQDVEIDVALALGIEKKSVLEITRNLQKSAIPSSLACT